MVTLREKRNLNRPPPVYKPPNVYLSLEVHYHGKMVTYPKMKYVGGERIILDGVVAKQVTLKSIRNSLVQWLFMDGEVRLFAIFEDKFKLMETDYDIKAICLSSLGARKVVFYVEEDGAGGQSKGKEKAVEDDDVDSLENWDEVFEAAVMMCRDQEIGVVMTDEMKGLGSRFVPYEQAFPDQGSKNAHTDVVEDDNDDDSCYNVGDYQSDETNTDVSYVDSNAEDETNCDGDSQEDDDVVVTEFEEYKDLDCEGEKPPLVFNASTIFDLDFELGMIFNSRDQFKKAVQSHAIATNHSLYYSKNAPTRVYAKCEANECDWRCHLSKMKDEETYIIREYQPEHKCTSTHHVRNMKPAWLAAKYIGDFVVDRNKPVSTFRKDAMRELGCEISREQAFRAKKLALRKLEGDPDQQYSKLWEYSEELRRTNPGSTILIGACEDEDGESKFNKCYICLDAVKKGFKRGCRPVIGLDGCHLKTAYKGVLLSAVGVDSNNGIYPIAWAVVRSETKTTWDWFLAVLKQDLEILDDSMYSFMSDKQNGLIQAMSEVFPNAEHRFCVRHLHENFKLVGFRGQRFKDALWSCAEATTVAVWKKRMAEMKAINEAAWQWLDEKPHNQWSKSHFSEKSKCDMVLNNVCEVFNSTILEAREMTILTMLEWIRKWMMVRFQKNREMASNRWKGRICPRIKKLLEHNAKKAHECIPIKGSNTHYEISCTNEEQFVVDLEKGTCSCRAWNLSGIPCTHAICAVNHQKLNRDDFVHVSYTIQSYKQAYAETIKGVNGAALWGESIYIPPLPPHMDRDKGRQHYGRRKKADEKAEKEKKGKISLKRKRGPMKCKICGGEGHKSVTCGREKMKKKKVSRQRVNAGASSSHSIISEGPSILPPSTDISHDEEEEAQLTQIPTQASVSKPNPIPGPSMMQQLYQGKRGKQGPLILKTQKKFLSISNLLSMWKK